MKSDVVADSLGKVGWLGRVLRVLAFGMVVGMIFFFGVRQGLEKVEKVKGNEFIGHSDEASYALQAKSVLQGRGIRVNYITYFFHAYPPEITHREDNWPAFLGYAIAPGFYFWGSEAWVARLPGIFMASVGLPLMAAWLAWAMCRRGYAALVAGLIMMAAPQVYGQSMRVLADGATAMMVAGFCAAMILAGRKGWAWLYVVAGVLIAGAYFAKGSELLLLGLYPVIAVMTCWKRFGVLADKWFWAGVVVVVLCLAPFCYANVRDYGHPFHSTQRYVTSFFGIEPTADWDKRMYYPYWDGAGAELPKISDRWEKHADYWHRSREQLFIALQYVLAGGSGSGDISGDFGAVGMKVRDYLEDKPPPTAAETQAAARRARNRKVPVAPATMKPVAQWTAPVWSIVGAMGMLLIAAAMVWATVRAMARMGVWGWRRIRKSKTENRNEAVEVGWVGRVLAVALVGAVHTFFLAYFWRVDSRFCFPMLPLILALGCTLGVAVLEGPFVLVWRAMRWAVSLVKAERVVKGMERVAGAMRLWPAVATVVVGVIVLCLQSRLVAAEKAMLDREGARPPAVGRTENPYVTTGRWIGKELPDAVVMCRNPWELLFYCGPANKAVALPYPEDDDPRGAEKIFAIARYYHVTHMLADVERPCMLPYFNGREPGLKKVEGGPRDLYEIDWNVAPKGTVGDVFGEVKR